MLKPNFKKADGLGISLPTQVEYISYLGTLYPTVNFPFRATLYQQNHETFA